ncbi:hypothetical protein [Echinimonas agarilytica]|nr:hypothetical protein [Echinimonas agarilytica]
MNKFIPLALAASVVSLLGCGEPTYLDVGSEEAQVLLHEIYSTHCASEKVVEYEAEDGILTEAEIMENVHSANAVYEALNQLNEASSKLQAIARNSPKFIEAFKQEQQARDQYNFLVSDQTDIWFDENDLRTHHHKEAVEATETCALTYLKSKHIILL